jgi:hypothetical protein
VSRHHRAQRWTTFTTWRRPEIERTLPQPCIRCGKAVHRDPVGWVGPTQWHVGHREDAADGGMPTRANTGPEHARCNLRAGGRRGAAAVHNRRASQRGIRPW